jgi:two-component system OmpR family response regulator
MAHLLLIEDDSDTAAEIIAHLEPKGYLIALASEGGVGLARARSGRFDLIIVDRMLPGPDGLSIIRTLRNESNATPALVLSALGAIDDRIRGLRAGGDDYLVKPFALGELSARIEALLRRPVESVQPKLRVGALELDLIRREATYGARNLDLLQREFQLLEYMMRREGQVVTRQMLLEDVFNYRFELRTNLIDVHMGRLRRKLDRPEEEPMITTVRGVGFILRAPA